MKNIAACGICCDVCGLHEKLGCVCSSGAEEIAKRRSRHVGVARAFCVWSWIVP